MIGQAKAFLRIVFEVPLDLIVAAYAKRCVDIAVASMKGVVARAVDSVTLACELRVRRILNRPCTELRPEGAAKLLSREQPRFDLAKLIPDEEQLSIHTALLSDSVWRAS